MVPEFTDCLSMSGFIGLVSKLVTVISFNYMVICGEVTPGFENDFYHTSFATFYGSMINIKFFGDNYNLICPLFILISGFLFALLSICSLDNQAVKAI